MASPSGLQKAAKARYAEKSQDAHADVAGTADSPSGSWQSLHFLHLSPAFTMRVAARSVSKTSGQSIHQPQVVGPGMLRSVLFYRSKQKRQMPNIAAILKSEFTRLARKEIRSESQSIKKALGAYRAENADLKKRIQSLEQDLRRLLNTAPKAAATVERAEQQDSTVRFSAKGLATHRKRLELSAADCGKLVGASALSIYKWESGKAKPRAKFLPAIEAFRAMGKKDAAAHLEALR